MVRSMEATTNALVYVLLEIRNPSCIPFYRLEIWKIFSTEVSPSVTNVFLTSNILDFCRHAYV